MPEPEGMTLHGMVARFDQMAWPFPCEKMDELQHRLRYGGATTIGDRLMAAEIVSAYWSLVIATDRKRRHVVRMLQRAQMIAGDRTGGAS